MIFAIAPPLRRRQPCIRLKIYYKLCSEPVYALTGTNGLERVSDRAEPDPG